MKTGIHPDHKLTEVACTCGNKFHVLSRHAKLSIDICSGCHPFFTGTQKFVDTAGRVEAFTKRFQWSEGDLQKMSSMRTGGKAQKVQKDLKTELEKRKLFNKKKTAKIVPEGKDAGR